MHNQYDGHFLYEKFKGYSYNELEEMLYNAKDDDEKKFYVTLCELYLSRNLKRVRKEKPF